MFAPLETHVGWRNIQIAFGAAKESAMSSGGGGMEERRGSPPSSFHQSYPSVLSADIGYQQLFDY